MSNIAWVYARLIIKGEINIEDVPENMRAEVNRLLEEI